MQYCEFLENYRLFTEGNETPEMMHLWCGLSGLAGAAEAKFWIDQNFFKLSLNLYVILLGPAGTVSKSIAMKPVLDMLKEVGLSTMDGEVIKQKIIEDIESMVKETPVGDSIIQHASVTYVADEFNVLLSAGIDMTQFLTEMFSKKELVYKTKKSGQYIVPNPFLNILGAAVPQYFGPYIASDMAATGLLARCIIVYEEEKRGKYPEPTYEPYQEKARQRCMEILYHITQMSGEITRSKEASQYYRDWYMEQDTTASGDHRINAYDERKVKAHTLKVAALMALGDSRQEIYEEDMKRAINILDEIEPKMRLAYAISGNNKLSPYIHRILNIIDDHGGKVGISKLMQMFSQDLSLDEFKELSSTVIEMGKAKKMRDESGKYWLVKR